MFVVTRIANGLVALLALLMAALFVVTAESSAGMVIAGMLGLVVLLFVLDMNFRKRNTSSDVGFAVMWTLLFAYTAYRGLKVLWAGSLPAENEVEVDFTFGAVIVAVYVLPFILNAIYLVRLYLPQGDPK